MQNVRALVWSYEERLPVLRDTHIRVHDRLHNIAQTSRAHSGLLVVRLEDSVRALRESVEGWIGNGN